ncbi:MAG: SPOR domain-containing protein [Thermoanaerobaculia bacterium]
MDPSDSSQNRRRIPAVSEVVAELSKRLLASPEQQPALFHAAQQVCAEELRLVRTGFRPAPFDELVERALRMLPAEMAGEAPGRPLENAIFPEDDPFGTIASPTVPQKSGEDGPFSLDSGRSLESYAAPEPPPLPPARPLELSERVPTPAPPSRSYREPQRVRSSSSTSALRVLIFLLLAGIGFAAYRFSQSDRWRFRASGRPSPPVARSRPAAASVPAAPAPSGTVLATGLSPTPAPPAARVPSAAPVPGPSTVVPPPASKGDRRSRPNPREAAARTAAPAAPPAPAESPRVSSAESALPESRGSSMISSDWSGRAPAYMIHFSSYQKRDNAERDRARLSKLIGKPFHVIEVNLGREGDWFRVMLGDFPSREEAQRERDALSAAGTPGMGFVYRVSGSH